MASAADRKSPVQMFTLVFGVVYLLVGILGFLNDPILGIFNVNPLHNVVHLAIGGALAFSSKDLATAKTVSLVVGSAYLLVALLGFVAKDFMEDLLDIDTADNFLHLVSGALGVYFGTAGAEMSRPTTA